MKDRPILFSAPMVRAILEGRKTQTRRVVKPQPVANAKFSGGYSIVVAKRFLRGQEVAAEMSVDAPYIGNICPYGQSGDRLWVRETWQGPLMSCDEMESEYRDDVGRFHKPEYCEYAADGGAAPEFITLDDELVRRWRPSIHMPRWASRILLEITGVRVERLADISKDDAMAEGVVIQPDGGFGLDDSTHYNFSDPTDSFASLWESINGAGSWAANPWVWIVEFKRVG